MDATEERYIEWLRIGLKKPGKTQIGLATHLGLAHPQVTQMLKGRRRLKVGEVSKIAEYLEILPPAMVFSAYDEPTMSLGRALFLLAQAHTDPDELVGFRVHATPSIYVGYSDYIEAWRVVREHLGLPIESPADTASQM